MPLVALAKTCILVYTIGSVTLSVKSRMPKHKGPEGEAFSG